MASVMFFRPSLFLPPTQRIRCTIMVEAVIGMNCARPECDHPGPKLCGSCRLVGYCCRTCQVEDWPRHKEEDCQGYLRKIGMSHLQKAKGFERDRNWVQVLRYSDLALVKLKKLNDRPIEELDEALRCKFNALNFMDRNREALECAKEQYCLYLTCHTHPPAINASFDLIESCLHNKEFEDAELYARTTWETITLSNDSHIPDNRRQHFTATGAYYLAKAMRVSLLDSRTGGDWSSTKSIGNRHSDAWNREP